MKKKILIGILAFLVLGAVVAIALLSGKDAKPSVNDLIVEDYETVLATYPRAHFYETEMVLDGCADSLLTSAKVILSRTVIQTADTVNYFDRNFAADTLVVSRECGHWTGSFSSDPRNLVLTVEDALEALVDCGLPVPHSNKVTLRRPLGTAFDNTVYIFGSSSCNYYLAVDGVTGQVTEIR